MRSLNTPAKSHQQWLQWMAQSSYLDHPIDQYNEGELVSLLEKRVAKLLGKPHALFFHKGVAAQLVALKVASQQKNRDSIIIHPQSHIAMDESQAYQSVMNLQAHLLGDPDQPFDCKALNGITDPCAAVTVELPLRRAGFRLTPWSELQNIQSWAKDHDCHFHMDGARLWESTHHYQRSLADIAALADSVYVSFYKGIGAIAGAMLAGSEDFIESCKVWRSRIGGDLYSAFPMLITALQGLDDRLPLIPSWVERAQEIAHAIGQLDGIRVNKPHTNGFVIYVDGEAKRLNQAKQRLDQQFNLRLSTDFMATGTPHLCRAEMQVGIGANDISTNEIVHYFQQLLQQ